MMDQEIEIISSETKKEKIKNFFINKKKIIISIFIILLLILFSFFFYQEYKKNNRELLANKYNAAIIQYEKLDGTNVIQSMKEIIEAKDKTYSPLAFYFLLDNNLVSTNEDINKFFDIIIEEVGLDREDKYLTIFKKGLFNSNFVDENELLRILNPLIKSDSVWKPHALYLMAEFYFAKNEKIKSKEFLDQLISLENISSKVKLEAQKRLSADFSE